MGLCARFVSFSPILPIHVVSNTDADSIRTRKRDKTDNRSSWCRLPTLYNIHVQSRLNFPFWLTSYLQWCTQNLGIHWASAVPGFIALACFPFPVLFYLYGKKLRLKCKYAAEAARILEEMKTGQRSVIAKHWSPPTSLRWQTKLTRACGITIEWNRHKDVVLREKSARGWLQ